MNTKGQTVKIFLVDGTIDGLKIVEKSNWVGKCISCSRTQFIDIKSKREEFNNTGVYLLYGYDDNNQIPNVYIGEGDPVLDRLVKHEIEKDFWQHLIVFTNKDANLNKAHVQYLESRLLTMATEAKKSKIENKKKEALPSLSESEICDLEQYLSTMIIIYGTLGLSIFEKPKTVISELLPNEILHLKGPNAEAKGQETNEGFIVFKGSKACKSESNSIGNSIKQDRKLMLDEDLFYIEGDSYVLTQDYSFSSPSRAAAIFLSRSANGRTEWKNLEGKTLKDIQNQQV